MDEAIIRLQKDLQIVVKNVAEWVRSELMDEIEVHVYQWGERMKREAMSRYGQESVYYLKNNKQPTYEFLNSIVCDPQLENAISGFVAYTVFSDPELMSLDMSNSLHGTWNTHHDYRAVLMERLNEAADDYESGNPNKNIWRWWTLHDQNGRYHFFDNFLARMEQEIYPQFEKEMTKIGWAWQRTGCVPDAFDSI